MLLSITHCYCLKYMCFERFFLNFPSKYQAPILIDTCEPIKITVNALICPQGAYYISGPDPRHKMEEILINIHRLPITGNFSLQYVSVMTHIVNGLCFFISSQIGIIPL